MSVFDLASPGRLAIVDPTASAVFVSIVLWYLDIGHLDLLASLPSDRGAAFANAPEALLVLDGRGRVTDFSNRAAELLQVPTDSIRGKEIVVYLTAESENQAELLGKLGKHTMGKSCLYLKSLADIDVAVLENLISGSIAELLRRYPRSA